MVIAVWEYSNHPEWMMFDGTSFFVVGCEEALLVSERTDREYDIAYNFPLEGYMANFLIKYFIDEDHDIDVLNKHLFDIAWEMVVAERITMCISDEEPPPF